MTTTMSEPRIWGSSSNRAEMRAALSSGWRRSDLIWERLQEWSNECKRSKRLACAAAGFLAGCVIACLCFRSGDARIWTSIANAGFVLRLMGAETLARRAYERAFGRWPSVGRSLDSIEIRSRARSSLFHLRMEAKHWDAYRANMAARLQAFIGETGECLEHLIDGRQVPHRLYSRWKGEKPSVFDDTRKILGACLLLASDSID